MPSTAEALTIAVLFFVPGFLAEWVLDRFSVRSGKSDFQRVLSALTISGLVWIVPGPFVYAYWRGHESSWNTYIVCALIIVVVPTVLAYIVAKWGAPFRLRLQRFLGLPVLDSKPTAWDFVFSQPKGQWVIVHTTDGETFGGKLDLHSCAGSHGARDLYLEERWWLDDDSHAFTERDAKSGGLYFAADSIEYIEFRVSDDEEEA